MGDFLTYIVFPQLGMSPSTMASILLLQAMRETVAREQLQDLEG